MKKPVQQWNAVVVAKAPTHTRILKMMIDGYQYASTTTYIENLLSICGVTRATSNYSITTNQLKYSINTFLHSHSWKQQCDSEIQRWWHIDNEAIFLKCVCELERLPPPLHITVALVSFMNEIVARYSLNIWINLQFDCSWRWRQQHCNWRVSFEYLTSLWYIGNQPEFSKCVCDLERLPPPCMSLSYCFYFMNEYVKRCSLNILIKL